MVGAHDEAAGSSNLVLPGRGRFAEKQGTGGFLSIGKSRAKVFMEKNTGVTFADVAGVDEVE